MLVKYIPQIVDFKSIPELKYDNAITRKEHADRISEECGRAFRPAADGSCAIDPCALLSNDDLELFAGDKIVGYFADGDKATLCLYEWKKSGNPRSIKAYSLLLELEEGLLVDGDVQLVQAHSPSGRLELFVDKKKTLLII